MSQFCVRSGWNRLVAQTHRHGQELEKCLMDGSNTWFRLDLFILIEI